MLRMWIFITEILGLGIIFQGLAMVLAPQSASLENLLTWIGCIIALLFNLCLIRAELDTQRKLIDMNAQLEKINGEKVDDPS